MGEREGCAMTDSLSWRLCRGQNLIFKLQHAQLSVLQTQSTMPHQQQGGGTPYKIRGGLSRAVKQKGIRKMIHEQNARKERGRRWAGEASPTASSTTATSASASSAPSSRLSREAAPSSVASREGAGGERGQAVKATIGLDLDSFKVNRTRLETCVVQGREWCPHGCGGSSCRRRSSS